MCLNCPDMKELTAKKFNKLRSATNQPIGSLNDILAFCSLHSKQQFLSRTSHWPLFAVVCSDSTVTMISKIICTVVFGKIDS